MPRHAAIVVAGLASVSLFAGHALGVDVDGTLDASMTPHAALQGAATEFGDADSGQEGFCNGSELDAGHIALIDGEIVVFLAGNLQSNFNKIELFLDGRDGGQNQLRHDNSETDFSGLLRMGNSNINATDGLRFDDEFVPDCWISFTCGDDGDGNFITHASYAPLHTEGGGFGFYLGSGASGAEGVLNGENGIQIGLNNSNTAGVSGGTGSSCGVDVSTGIEIVIPSWCIDWDFEGLPLDQVKACVFINGSGHDYLSNQILDGMPPGNNLGEPRGLDFNDIAGNQFFAMGDEATECPEYEIGACCLGETCFVTDPKNCTVGGGIFQGIGTGCDESTCLPPDCPSDINGDGETDVDDLLELLSHYGEICI